MRVFGQVAGDGEAFSHGDAGYENGVGLCRFILACRLLAAVDEVCDEADEDEGCGNGYGDDAQKQQECILANVRILKRHTLLSFCITHFARYVVCVGGAKERDFVPPSCPSSPNPQR
jgi:hypothetical protein